MVKQLSFFQDIDGEKTKQAVETILERYRIYMLAVPDEQLPRITPSYSLVPPSNTNAFYSSTESAVIRKIDKEREREEFIQRMCWAVNKLSQRERELITKRYMTLEDVHDYMLYPELGMSEKTYYNVKKRAFYKLALALRIEVYKQKAPV